MEGYYLGKKRPKNQYFHLDPKFDRNTLSLVTYKKVKQHYCPFKCL